MYTIAVGNPFDGIILHGVFNTAEDANYYAEGNFTNEEWWIKEIEEQM